MEGKPKPKPKPKAPDPKGTYSWTLSPQGVFCYTNPQGGQTIETLHEAATLSDFHDKTLAEATKEINAILARAEKSKPSEDVELSFITFQNQPFLVWAQSALGPHDDETVVAEALGLKRPRRKRT